MRDDLSVARWECSCKVGPKDGEEYYDRNCVPRCPRCHVALGGVPKTASEMVSHEDGDPNA